MPFIEPPDIMTGAPLPGWKEHFFHSENTTRQWTIAADADPLHEHHHQQEEVWSVAEGEVMISIDGNEKTLGSGDAAIIPPNTPHSARTKTACRRATLTDFPLRHELLGVAH